MLKVRNTYPSVSKLTHITFINIEDFLKVLSPRYCGDRIVNDIMMENDYIFSFLDEFANIYYRLALKTLEEHSEALKQIVKSGYLVVVL